MKRSTHITQLMTVFFLGIALFIAASSLNANALEAMDSEEFDEFYLASSFKTPTTREIYIPSPKVSFSDLWLLEFENETTRRYRRVIKKNYAKALKKELGMALKKQGWKVVARPTGKSLELTAHLHDLHILAPEQTPGKVAIILRNVGSAAVTLELKSPSGSHLMKIVDHEMTPDIVGSPLANRSYNFVYFKKLMVNWANMSSGYIESLIEQVEKHIQEKS